MLYKHDQDIYAKEARKGSKALYFGKSLAENVCTPTLTEKMILDTILELRRHGCRSSRKPTPNCMEIIRRWKVSMETELDASTLTVLNMIDRRLYE